MTLTIRSKVLLLSLTLFSIPYVGYEYVREMEKYLRDNLETSLMDTARALASVLNDRQSLFNRNLLEVVSQQPPLHDMPKFYTPFQLDGDASDWQPYLADAPEYGRHHLLRIQAPYQYQPTSLRFKHVMGKYRGHIYALFQVQDDQVVYRASDTLRLDRSDHLQIVIQDHNERFQRYVITPLNSGWVNGFRVSSHVRALSSQIESRIQGSWAKTETGYVLELRIPLHLVGDRLGFAIADVDNVHRREVKSLIATVGINHIDNANNVFIDSPQIAQIIRSLGDTPGRRIWVLDQQRRVFAQNGDLHREFASHPLNALYSLLLPPASENFNGAQASLSRLETEQVQAVLTNRADVRWRSTTDERAVIVSAGHPILVNDDVIGAVIVEETSNSIQTVQRQAIANLVNKTLLVFSVVTVLLLVFASRLSIRLRHLRNQAETAIDANGRVTTSKIGSDAKDEIGDLSRSFSLILEKLKQYNNYLEGMASKLSHELRTPIAVVRSSLDNLEQESLPSDSLIYIDRAKQGIDRLNTIITRLSEATRLEQALQTEEREPFDLTELVSSCVASYRLAYPNQRFQAEIPPSPFILEGAPDLIAQMLDKLVSNAVDFSTNGAPVQILIHQERQMIHLEVINYGINLPAGIQERLFESMVSLRQQQSTKKEPHLGLGLYMVRLIAGYHGGQVKAKNTPNSPGASFTVSLPARIAEFALAS